MRNKLLLLFVCAAVSVSAKVRLQPMFTDNMVLQQQTDAPIWGEARANAAVKVETSWDNKFYMVKADNTGRWSVKVKTPAAGGPYTVTISDGKPVVLHNVMIGEVWLCSGQSNMEMPVVGPDGNDWGKVNNYKAEQADAGNHPGIRLLRMEKNTNLRPQTDIVSAGKGWQVCSSAAIGDFSAAAYFFGRDIEKYRNVPVGLIETCWGGTPVQGWISEEALATIPECVPRMKDYREDQAALGDADGGSERMISDWIHRASRLDDNAECGSKVWTRNDFDDSAWKQMSVPCDMHENGVGNFYGIVWFRKTVDIPKSWEGRPITLNLGVVDARDLTFFNGHELGFSLNYDKERVYTVPADVVKAGKAVITVMCQDAYGEGGLRGASKGMALVSKKGTISIEGDWRFKTWTPQNRVNYEPYQTVCALYNAMINPIIPYSIKGAIWYQGENNVWEAYKYRDMLPVMINDWRTRWGYEFPFYIAQLANFKGRQTEPCESQWAELREAQTRTLAMKNTGMAVLIDIGEANDIHPKNKQEVGRRLALAARRQAYGENIPYSGPMYTKYEIEGNTIRLFFNCCDGGLKTGDGGTLKGFTIAGTDHKFHWADAKIDGNTVVVSSKDVALPLAVRYAWADNPVCNLYNGVGLPASPFRTDDWPGLTLGK